MLLTKVLASSLPLLWTYPVPSYSWQTEIHNQIGFMAEIFLSEASRSMAASLLEPEYKGSIGRAAGWADGVRKQPYPYSYSWHFISARDNPPNDCGLYYHRDCQEGGCVVQQIWNQTTILEQCITNLRDKKDPGGLKCSEALKWISHFIGDIAQPLHTSERSYGGNSIKVKFNGTDTNLHQVWDKEILYAKTGVRSFPGDQIDPYFVSLAGRIARDKFRSPVSTWAMCDLDARRQTYCPEQWAKDSNSIVCDYAYGRYVNGSDLWTGPERYADGAIHIIEEQIGKAAYRLSGWLNTLVARVMNTAFEEDTKADHVDM